MGNQTALFLSFAFAMTEQEAKIILELPNDYDVDEVVDAYDQKLWEVRDYIFRNTPIHTLFKSRIKRLERVKEAVQLLLPLEVDADQTLLEWEADIHWSLLDFLREYERFGVVVRQRISEGNNIGNLIANMELLLELQTSYNNYVRFRLQEYEVNQAQQAANLIDFDVKIGKQLDSGVFIKHLETLEKEGIYPSQIAKINKSNKAAFAAIYTEAHRVHKYMQLQQK